MARRPRFDKLIDEWERVMQRAFLDAVQRIRDRAELQQIVRMIERRDIEGALRAVGLDPEDFTQWVRKLEDAFSAGGKASMSAIPVVRDSRGFLLNIQFSVRNPAAELWLRERSSRFVTEVLEDQRRMIRRALADALAKGMNPRVAGLSLIGKTGAGGVRKGGLIGLTSSQEEWVRGFAEKLASEKPLDALTYGLRDKRYDSMIRLAAKNKKPLSAGEIDRMVSAYRNRALLYRSEVIARTETMAALHEAQEQAMDQAVSSGVVNPRNVTMVWRTAHDDRVRDSHLTMDGQERPMGQPFLTGAGVSIRFPGDPLAPIEETAQCRCWREPKVNFFAGVT